MATPSGSGHANAVRFDRERQDFGAAAPEGVRDGGRALRLDVADTGIGIDDAYLPSIFQPFSQAHSGWTRRYEGSGLGLALARSFLVLNGATLSVRSGKGSGSVFTVHFAVDGEVVP